MISITSWDADRNHGELLSKKDFLLEIINKNSQYTFLIEVGSYRFDRIINIPVLIEKPCFSRFDRTSIRLLSKRDRAHFDD